VKFNHIDFNGEWASTITVEAFIEHEKHHGLSEKELRDIHALILIEHGDNSGVQKQIDIVEETDGGSSGDLDTENRGEPGAVEPGADDGRKKKGR
jgi:hypothetical protein